MKTKEIKAGDFVPLKAEDIPETTEPILDVDKMSLGVTIDRLKILRDMKAEINKKFTEIQEEFDLLSETLIYNMKLQDLEKASGEKATASIKTVAYPRIEKWETFLSWAVKNKRYDMIQRRVNEAPFREMLEIKNQVPPGLNQFNKTKLSLRTK